MREPLDPFVLRGSPRGLGALATLVYGTMIALALALLAWRQPEQLFARLMGGSRLRLDLILGLGFGLLIPLLDRFLIHFVQVFRFIEEEIGHWLGPITAPTAARLAILSGIGEELLFRGVLQAHLGWAAATVLFGLCHIGPDRRFLAWTAYATVMGGVFGWMALHTGNLLAPAIAHVTVNYLGLLWIGARRETTRAAVETSPHSSTARPPRL